MRNERLAIENARIVKENGVDKAEVVPTFAPTGSLDHLRG